MKWIRRSIARRADAAGFTVVDVIASVVITGIVIAPMSIALVQALNLVPESGARTTAATDMDRLQAAMNDDVAQAQSLELFLTPTFTTSGGTTTGATAGAAFPQWTEVSATKWSSTPLTGWLALAAITGCPTLPIRSGTVTTPLFDSSWSDGLDAATRGLKSPPDVLVKYELWFSNAQPGLFRVDVHRLISTSGSALSDQGVYASGYCGAGDTIVSLPYTNVTDNQQHMFNLALQLRPLPGKPQNALTISATARPNGPTS